MSGKFVGNIFPVISGSNCRQIEVQRLITTASLYYLLYIVFTIGLVIAYF
jgi:hypothetical protein